MGESEDFMTVVTTNTVDLYKAAIPEDTVCIHVAVLLKQHLLKVGLDRPTTIGIETEYGEYDPTIQKAIIRLETEVEK